MFKIVKFIKSIFKRKPRIAKKICYTCSKSASCPYSGDFTVIEDGLECSEWLKYKVENRGN